MNIRIDNYYINYNENNGIYMVRRKDLIMKLIGKIYENNYEIKYYDNGTFELKNINRIKNMTDEEYFKNFAIVNNSPWSYRNESWVITYEDENLYKCCHYVIGYDMIQSELYAYGDTEIKALENCMKFFKEFQEKWNPEGEYF